MLSYTNTVAIAVTYVKDNDDVTKANVTMKFIFDVIREQNLIDRIIITDLMITITGIMITTALSYLVYSSSQKD